MKESAAEKGKFIMNVLECLGVDGYASLDAIDDHNINKSYRILKENPHISKQEFLNLMNIEEYFPNTIPHPYRDYGDGKFEPHKLFNDIKVYVESGNNVNTFFKQYSTLYEYLDHYYQLIIYNQPAPEDDKYNDSTSFSKELTLPLKERTYDVASELQWLIDHGADPNAGGDLLPLMLPVAFLDFYMAEYLLEHGANAHYHGDSEAQLPYGCGNYYIDDLDASALNYSFEPNVEKIVFDQILKFAVLFAKHGVVDVHTHCISIDNKTQTVTVAQAQTKF